MPISEVPLHCQKLTGVLLTRQLLPRGGAARLRTAAEGEREGAGRNVQRFRGGFVFKAHRLCVSLNSRLESNKEKRERTPELYNPEP